MGLHLPLIEQGQDLRLPRHWHVCRLCHIGALGYERHMLFEWPALAGLSEEFSLLVTDCTGVMARLVWAKNHPMVYVIACPDADDDRQMLSHSYSLFGWREVKLLPSLSSRDLSQQPSFSPILRRASKQHAKEMRR